MAEWQGSAAQVSISVFNVCVSGRMKAGRLELTVASKGFDIFLFILKLSDQSEERRGEVYEAVEKQLQSSNKVGANEV